MEAGKLEKMCVGSNQETGFLFFSNALVILKTGKLKEKFIEVCIPFFT